MASVTYRKRGDSWFIRFRGKKGEITKKYPGTLREDTIAKKANWYEEQIALGRVDPWAEKEQEQRRKRLGMDLATALKRYISDGVNSGRWKTDSKGRSRTAQTNRERIGYLLESIGNIPVADLSGEVVNKYIQSLDVSAYSKSSYLTSINTFLKWLYDEGHKERLERGKLPYATRQRVKQVEKTPRGVKLGQMKRLAAASREYSECAPVMIWLSFACMLRRGEVNKIYPVDVSGKELQIGNMKQDFRPEFIPKGGIAVIPTTRLMRRGLDVSGLDPHRPIFDCSVSTLRRAWRAAKDRAGIDARFHDLRHGGVMYYRSMGWPESLVSLLARHESSSTTAQMYGGIDTREARRTLDRYDK